jgi:hypothetical protein
MTAFNRFQETEMTDETTSQAQNGLNFLNKLFTQSLGDQGERLDSWHKQLDKLQTQGYEQADQAMDNAAALNRASMRYAQALTQDVWEIGIEAVQNAGNMFTPKG